MDFEIAHMNVSIQTEKEKEVALAALAEKNARDADEGVSGCPWEDDHPIVDWHTDSYPFVCVLMLSDCTNMIGGETALRTGTGEIMRVRGPGMVCLHSISLQSQRQVADFIFRVVLSSFKVVTLNIKLFVHLVANESPWSPLSVPSLP